MKIKVFVDAHVFDGEFQGTRTFIEGIYTLLAEKPDLHLYIGAYDVENLKKHFPASANITFVKFKSTSPFIRLMLDIPAIIRKYAIRYAHFQYIIPPIKNCRQIVTTHDVIFNEYPEEFPLSYRIVKKIFFKISAQRADIITTVSEYSRKSIQRYLAIKKKIHVIPNGVNPRFFLEYNKQESKNIVLKKYGLGRFILFVSRIEPRKNHILLLKAYLDLKLYSSEYYLVLLGKKTLNTQELDDMVNSQPPGIKRFLFISNEVDNKDLLHFYRAADLFVYPSKAEGFGIPPLEAAALKTPVICSNTSAMSDFTFFGENHVNPYEYEHFKARIAAMIKKPPLPGELADLSNLIKSKYSWNESAEKLYQIILAHNNTSGNNY